MSSRPDTVPPGLTVPDPVTEVNWPFTGTRPQRVLLMNRTEDRSGTRVHDPTALGSIRSFARVMR